jgi:hypothetical protein
MVRKDLFRGCPRQLDHWNQKKLKEVELRSGVVATVTVISAPIVVSSTPISSPVTQDARCLDLLLNLWWMVKTKNRFFASERTAPPIGAG